jgi:hypothetical protein
MHVLQPIKKNEKKFFYSEVDDALVFISLQKNIFLG